jgi:hypothetical protein
MKRKIKYTEKMDKAEEMKTQNNEEDTGCKGTNDLSVMN